MSLLECRAGQGTAPRDNTELEVFVYQVQRFAQKKERDSI